MLLIVMLCLEHKIQDRLLNRVMPIAYFDRLGVPKFS